ncbi:MAG: hypothetical protein ISS74_09015 [Planctomycetes bacterium]|nr:hypothetical protein [Planctomycetota bacterium]
MITRTALVAVLVAGLLLAGCKSEPEPVSQPTTSGPAAPTETPTEAPPSEAPAEAKGIDWAVGQAPADAGVVAAVASLSDLETNLKALLGPDAEDLKMVEEIRRNLPAGAFDVAGPLVFILPAGMEKTEPVVLLRATDASAITGKNAGAGIVEMDVGEEAGGQRGTVFVLALDGWAMVAPKSAAAIKAVMRAEKKLKLTDDQRAALADHMVWLHLNPPALADLAVRALDKAQEQMRAQAAPGQAMPEEPLKLLHWMLDVAKDVTAVDVVGDVTAEGIRAQARVDLAEGSNLAAIAGAGVPVRDYAMGLPVTENLVLAVWGGMDWQKAMPPMKALIKPMFDMLAEGKDEKTRKALDDVWASYEKWGGVLGDRLGMVMETAPPGAGMFQLVEVFTVKDAEAYRALFKDYMTTSMDAMDVLMKQFMGMPGMGAMPSVKADVTFSEAAETIDDVRVDIMRIALQIDVPPDAPPQAAQQMKDMMEMIYGPEGLAIRMAVVGKMGVVALGGKETMARAIAAAKGQAPDLTTQPNVAKALQRVPGGQGAMLLSASNYMYMAMGMVDRMMAKNVPPEILAEAEKAGHGPLAKPPAADLILGTGAAEGHTLRLMVDVPASDLRAAVQLVKQFGERMEFIMKKQQEMAEKQQQPPPPPAPGT